MSTVDHRTVSRSRGWSALPRRRPPRPRPAVFTLRVPISTRSRIVLIALSIVVPLVAWWILSVSGVVQPAQYLPSPGATLLGLRDLALSGELFTDAWASIQRVGWGYGIAVLVSVPLGIAMGSFRSVWSLFEPVIGLLRYLPAGAFSPLLIIWLGLGEEPKASLIFIGTFFFNTLMTADVVRGVPLNIIDVSYTLGARTGEVIRKVIVPYSLPGIVDCVRVNAAAAWSFVVIAELLAPESGLAYRIARLARFQNFDKVFAVLVVIALIGLTIDIALRVLRDLLARWV